MAITERSPRHCRKKGRSSVHCAPFVKLGMLLVSDLGSLQFYPSNNWVCGTSSSCSLVTSFGCRKLGWLVEARSLAHILSVITTMFCLSVTRCIPINQKTSLEKTQSICLSSHYNFQFHFCIFFPRKISLFIGNGIMPVHLKENISIHNGYISITRDREDLERYNVQHLKVFLT